MRSRSLYFSIPILMAALIFFTSACFLLGKDVKEVQEKAPETGDAEKLSEALEGDREYAEYMGELIRQLREALEKAEEAIGRFENEEIGINEINAYINEYIESIENVNEKFLKTDPPPDAQNIHSSFRESMQMFLNSTDNLDKYQETSILNINQKIEYLEQAYKQALQGEQLLDNTEQMLNEYQGK
ncbi:MAG: hypothetical protein R6U35_05230 [Candidatus Humimicrobiaceae bacterium]